MQNSNRIANNMTMSVFNPKFQQGSGIHQGVKSTTQQDYERSHQRFVDILLNNSWTLQ